jgi:hypothetical protein
MATETTRSTTQSQTQINDVAAEDAEQVHGGAFYSRVLRWGSPSFRSGGIEVLNRCETLDVADGDVE